VICILLAVTVVIGVMWRPAFAALRAAAEAN
jgi:hypothetical protein